MRSEAVVLSAMILVCSTASRAETALEQARAHTVALRYTAASKALKQVSQQPGLTHADVIEFYELSAIVAASTGNSQAAKEAFAALVLLEPGYKLKGRYSPKVTTPFFEGKAFAQDHGALSVSLASSSITNARVGQVTLAFSRDDRSLVKTVEVTVLEDGASRTLQLPFVAKGKSTLEVSGKAVDLRLTLIGANAWVLAHLPPLTVEVPPPVVETQPPPPPVPLTEAPLVASATSSPLRPIAYGLAGLGAAGLITGAIFGISSQTARTTVLNAQQGTDLVTTITRAHALELSQQASSQALIANIALIAGGTVLATGVVLWLLGLPSSPHSPTLSVLPTASGVVGQVGFSW